MAAKPTPPLNAPASSATVQISAIDTTLKLVGIQCDQMWDASIKGFDRVRCGSWASLIEHPSGRKLLYDLGCRKDWRKLAPAIGLPALVESDSVDELSVEKNVSELLQEGGLGLEKIEGVVWSHWHFDHTGDPSTFPSSTKLIVGEGFQKAFLPGYPADPEGRVLESDFKDRDVMEVPFNTSSIRIGRFKAFDYFGDGSFYILDAPGHSIGHVNALARTHASPTPAFVHLGGDSIHHAGEIRPSEYLPLPDSIKPSPLPSRYPAACPGEVFEPILRNGSRSEHILEYYDPFRDAHADAKFALIYDEPALRDTVRKDEELDADRDVFTICAHDWSLKGVIPEWPHSLNQWREDGLKESTRWKFLEDFEEACGRQSSPQV